MEEIQIELHHISKRVSNAFFLKRISFQVRPGEVYAFVGPNAAGKSALFSVIMGILPADSGEIYIKGKPAPTTGVAAVKEQGLMLIDQHQQMFENLSVYENLFFGQEILMAKNIQLLNHKKMRQKAADIFAEMGILMEPAMPCSQLTAGQRQLLGIARAVVSDADVILLDEPTTQLNTQEKRILYRAIKKLTEKGTSFLLISHDLKEVLETADTIYVMEKGEIVKTVPAQESSFAELVQAVYGFSPERLYERPRETFDEELLRIELHDAQNTVIRLGKGQVLALMGDARSGVLDIAAGLAGTGRLDAAIYLEGKQMAFTSPIGPIRAGIIAALGEYDQEQLREAALVARAGGDDNAAGRSKLRARILRNDLSRLFSGFAVKREQSAYESGGNVHWMQIEQAISQKARLYVLYNPGAGLDLPSKMRLYHEIGTLLAQGAGAIFITADPDEAFGYADQVAVIQDKKVVRYGKTGEIGWKEIEELMTRSQNNEVDRV